MTCTFIDVNGADPSRQTVRVRRRPQAKPPVLRDNRTVSEVGEWVQVDSGASQPLFDQLRTQIIEAVRGGRLLAGIRLPTVRELAAELGLAVNTVARAYRELETAGIVETKGRFGTFIAHVDPADATMAAAAGVYADAARSLGVSRADAIRYVEIALQ